MRNKKKGDWTVMWRIHDIIPGDLHLQFLAKDTADRMKEIVKKNNTITKKMEVWLDSGNEDQDVTLEAKFTSGIAVDDFLKSENGIGWEQVEEFLYHELRFIYSEPNILGADTFRKPGRPLEVCMRLTDSRKNLIEH